MKKLLLCAALVAAAIPQVVALEGKTTSNLKLVWKNTDLKGVSSRAYQGHVYDDKYYIMCGADNKVHIFSKDDKVGEIDAPNCWMNFGHDEAGNMILRQSEDLWTTFYADSKVQWTIGLLDPKTNEITFCKNLPDGYQNKYGGATFTFGTAMGDVFSKDPEASTTATMAIAPQYGGTNPIKFWGGNVATEGAHCGEWDWQYYKDPESGEINEDLPSHLIDPVAQRNGEPKVGTTCIISTYSWFKKFYVDEDDDETRESYLPEAVALNPYYDLTGESNGTGNSITHLINNGRDEFTWGGFYVTPGHNGNQGFEMFESGDDRYIVYCSGAENCDGFSVAKVDKDYDSYLRTTPESKPEDYDYLIASKGFDVDQDGDQLWQDPGHSIFCYINSFDVVPSDEAGHVFIYQYVPGAYIAKYDLDLNSSAGVADTFADNDDTKVYGATGKITVIGGDVDIYTIDGRHVAHTAESVACNPGIYVVKTAKKAVKVIVK